MQCPRRYVDHRVPIGRAGLEQYDLRSTLAQAIGEHATRRSGADDHVFRMQIRHGFDLTAYTPSFPRQRESRAAATFRPATLDPLLPRRESGGDGTMLKGWVHFA